MSSALSAALARPPMAAPDFRFQVRAAADPGSLPRVLELFALRDLVPTQVHCRLDEEAGGAMLAIEIVVAGMGEHEAAVVAAKLDQLVPVARATVAPATSAQEWRAFA